VPLFDYSCRRCAALTEVLLRSGAIDAPVVCSHCGSNETVRAVSRFSFKSRRRDMYSEGFREKAAPFLKSRPGAAGLFAQGGESEEAKVYRLTEQIGRQVDGVLRDQVFKNLQS
jgi:putative FmdB family regulatory protein